MTILATWIEPGVAQQSVVGAVPTPVDATGVTDGVAMTGQGGGGTLVVGVVGGPDTNIFTNNSIGGAVIDPTIAAVTTDVSSLSDITFNSGSNVFGTIGITPPASPLFANLTAGNVGSTVNFFGNVDATTLTLLGTGTVNFNSGSTNLLTSIVFGGDGTVGLAANTTVTPGALTTTAGTDTGTLVLGGGSVLAGAVGAVATSISTVTVAGGNNNAGVSATIGGALFAYTFNLGTNTLNVGGAVTIADLGPGGVINTTIASPTVFGSIAPVGAANLGPLLINVTVPNSAVIPLGTNFNIVNATSGTNGIIATPVTVAPSNPLYIFSQVPITGTVAGLVTITTTGIPLTAPIVDPIAAPTAPVLVKLLPSLVPGTVLFDIVGTIGGLSTADAVADALAQLAPSTPDLAAPLVTFKATRQFQNTWLSRMDNLMCGEVNQRKEDQEETAPACQAFEPQSGWWAKGFGYWADQNARDGFTGYDTETYGSMLAFDTPILRDQLLGQETRAGLGIGYANSRIEGDVYNASTDIDTYQATAYISHEAGPLYVQGDASFGWNEYAGTHNIAFGGVNVTPEADYSGQDYTLFANSGYHLYSNGFTITPNASLQYTRVHIDGYTETGAEDASLQIDAQNYDFLESGLGAKAAYPFGGSNGTYVPEAHVNWFHKIANPTLSNSAAFTAPGSDFFTTTGMQAADDLYNVGGGITFLSCACSASTWSLEGVYDYYGDTNGYSGSQFMIKLTSHF